MSRYTIKRGDTDPAFAVTLMNGAVPLDLSAATRVHFIVRKDGALSPIVNAAMTIVSPATSGAVSYAWQAGDTATAGEYLVEYEITWNNGKRRTVPTPGKDVLVIESDLGDAP